MEMKNLWTRDDDRGGWSVVCPVCGKDVTVLTENVEDTVGATFNCPNCRVLLLHDTEAGVVEMHPYLHSKDPSWPADGRNTSYVDMREKMADLGIGK